MRGLEAVLAVLMVLILWPVVLAAAVIPLAQDIAARRQTRREAAWLAEYPHGPSAVHDIDTDPDTLTEERDDAWAAAEEEAAQVDRLATIRTHYQENQ